MSDNTLQAEGLGDFFKNLGKSFVKMGQKIVKNVLKNTGRAMEPDSNVGSAFASQSPKAALPSLPEVIIFYQTVKGLFFEFSLILCHLKWTKDTDYTHHYH